MNFAVLVEALQKNDRETFISELNKVSPDALTSLNDVRYAKWFSGKGATILQLAAFRRPEFAAFVLQRGAELDLHSACALGDVDAVRVLLEQDPDGIDLQVDTFFPIQLALRHPPVLRVLLEHGDDPDSAIQKLAWFDWESKAHRANLSDWRLMHMIALGSVGDSSIESAELLREFGADLSPSSSPLGDAPIHLAAIYDQTKLIRWFVSHGCDVDTPTTPSRQLAAVQLFDHAPFSPFFTYKKTPLMLALGEGQLSAAEALLKLGADINAVDSGGYAPIHYAAGPFWEEDSELLELLIDAGANPKTKAVNGHRPIDLAEKKGYSETVDVLRSAK